MTDVSNRVYGVDDDLTGIAPSSNRQSMVGIGIGGFRFNLVQPTTSNTYAANDQTNDAKWPKLEAAYTLPIGKDFTFGIAGGFQNLEATNAANGNMEYINSYMGERNSWLRSVRFTPRSPAFTESTWAMPTGAPAVSTRPLPTRGPGMTAMISRTPRAMAVGLPGPEFQRQHYFRGRRWNTR